MVIYKESMKVYNCEDKVFLVLHITEMAKKCYESFNKFRRLPQNLFEDISDVSNVEEEYISEWISNFKFSIKLSLEDYIPKNIDKILITRKNSSVEHRASVLKWSSLEDKPVEVNMRTQIYREIYEYIKDVSMEISGADKAKTIVYYNRPFSELCNEIMPFLEVDDRTARGIIIDTLKNQRISEKYLLWHSRR